MNLRKLFEQLLIQNCYEDIKAQARAVFATWCIVNHYEADTAQADILLMNTYDIACIVETDISFEEFENYMYELIV